MPGSTKPGQSRPEDAQDWREGPDDDLVLPLAIAAWEHQMKPGPRVFVRVWGSRPAPTLGHVVILAIDKRAGPTSALTAQFVEILTARRMTAAIGSVVRSRFCR